MDHGWVVIRDARTKDSQKALPAWDEFMAYHSNLSAHDFDMVPGARDMWRKYFERHVRSRLRKALIAERDGEIIGFLLGELRKLPPIFTTPRQAYVDSLGVVESERNKGIGALLLNSFEEWAKERQMPFITLNVRAENKSAIRFYERCGFKAISLVEKKLL